MNIRRTLVKGMSIQAELYRVYNKLIPINMKLSELSKEEYCIYRNYAIEDLQTQLENIDRFVLQQYLKISSKRIILKAAVDNNETTKKILRIFSIFSFMKQLDICLSSDIKYDKIDIYQ